MDKTKICICCLVSCMHKDLNTTYIWLGKTEIYSDMLHECFNINLNKEQECNSICETCIGRLRESLSFKLQILNCEKELTNKLKEIELIDNKSNIKIEPKEESEGSDTDNYLLADYDSVKDEFAHIKQKTEQKRKKCRDLDNWKPKKIKTIVKRISKSRDISVRQKKAKSDMPVTIEYDSKTNCTWTTRINHEKKKHRENLVTILKYSNVTPFKTKSLLGYNCGYCDNTYPDPADLRNHTKEDHKNERLEFRSSFDMTEYHVNLDVTDLSCTLCDENMSNLTFLVNHLARVHEKNFNTDIKDHLMQFKLKKGDVYDCAICTSTYETFKMLKQHMNKHYSNYTCSKCDACFAMKRSLNSHLSIHQEGSFKCDHCEKIFSSKNKKQYHEKTKHFGTRHIRNCPYCNESFRSYYQRNQHLVKVHNSEAQYKCNVCNKSFVLKSLLMCHIKKNHLMERNCQCTECGYSFFSKKALKAHMIKHNGERKYTCEVCHKAYARKYTLREHMRIHNEDRRFKCEVCGGAFVQKCSLKSHLLAHHGISLAASDITVT